MQFRIAKDTEEVAELAAFLVKEQLQSKKDSHFLLATGATMVPIYERLQRLTELNHAYFSNLDEYWGVGNKAGNSFAFYLEKHLFSHLQVPKSHISLFQGDASSWKDEQKKRQQFILARDGIDFTFLGLGVNGHIAFNEPPSDLNTCLRLIQLSEKTKEQNFRKHSLPEMNQAITMGVKEIFASKTILMLVTGESKKAALQQLIELNPTPDFPASLMKLHPGLILICDEVSASLLKNH